MITKDFILKTLAAHDCKIYEVRSGGHAKGGLLSCQLDDGWESAAALKRLEHDLNSLEGAGVIYIKAKTAPSNKGGDNRKVFEYTLNLNGAQQPTAQPISGIASHPQDTASIEASIRANMQREFDDKQKIYDLQRQIDGLKEAGPLDKYMGPLMQVLAMKLAPQTPAQPPINGHPEDETSQEVHENPMEQTERINQALSRLMEVDPDFIDHLEILAEIAQTNQAVYNMAIDSLKKI